MAKVGFNAVCRRFIFRLLKSTIFCPLGLAAPTEIRDSYYSQGEFGVDITSENIVGDVINIFQYFRIKKCDMSFSQNQVYRSFMTTNKAIWGNFLFPLHELFQEF